MFYISYLVCSNSSWWRVACRNCNSLQSGGNTQIRNVCYWITKRCHLWGPLGTRTTTTSELLLCGVWKSLVHIKSGRLSFLMAYDIPVQFIYTCYYHYIQWSWMLYPRWMVRCDTIYVYSGYWLVIILLSSPQQPAEWIARLLGIACLVAKYQSNNNGCGAKESVWAWWLTSARLTLPPAKSSEEARRKYQRERDMSN